MNPRIVALADELARLINFAPARPTQQDRNKLMGVRRRFKDLLEEDEIQGSEVDKTDCRFLLVSCTQLANKQEAFYESNGNQWEPEPAA